MKILNRLKELGAFRISFYKCLILLVPFFLLISLVLAETTQIQLNNPVTIGGKQVVLEQISDTGQVVINVAGQRAILEIGEVDDINGLSMKLNEMKYVNDNEGSATFEITIEYECGDGTCNTGEVGCCNDCGCENDTECVENKCIEKLVDQCLSYLDCDDQNEYTLDSCEGEPKICEHTNQTEPVQCYVDSQCSTDIKCMISYCGSNKCETRPITACTSNDNCCPAGCIYPDDSDCKAPCKSAKQCKDANPCTLDDCADGGCVNSLQQGCILKNKCLPINAIKKVEGITSYCSSESKWKAQKAESAACSENYECKSKVCTEGICAKEKFNLFRFITGLFTKIFEQ